MQLYLTFYRKCMYVCVKQLRKEKEQVPATWNATETTTGAITRFERRQHHSHPRNGYNKKK